MTAINKLNKSINRISKRVNSPGLCKLYTLAFFNLFEFDIFNVILLLYINIYDIKLKKNQRTAILLQQVSKANLSFLCTEKRSQYFMDIT